MAKRFGVTNATVWTDGGDLAALRYGQWKLSFLEQRAHGPS